MDRDVLTNSCQKQKNTAQKQRNICELLLSVIMHKLVLSEKSQKTKPDEFSKNSLTSMFKYVTIELIRGWNIRFLLLVNDRR